MKKIVYIKTGYSYNEVQKAIKLVAKAAYITGKEGTSPPLVFNGNSSLNDLILNILKDPSLYL